MYALSTLLFVSVLLLLILINVSPSPKERTGKVAEIKKSKKTALFLVRRILPAAMAIVVIAGGIFYSSKEDLGGTNQVIVYNWGEYLDPEEMCIRDSIKTASQDFASFTVSSVSGIPCASIEAPPSNNSLYKYV